MILFLDFDGVMHPVNQVSLFCREEHLARVLRCVFRRLCVEREYV